MATASTLRRLRVLLLVQLAAVLALSLWRQAPPTPLPADAPPERFSAARARAVAERLSAGLGPHPFGAPDNARLRERLLAELRALGFAPASLEVQSRTGCSRRGRCALVANVLAGLPGRAGPPGEAPTVLVAAHYDSVSTGPGASDDLSGVAALLETARALRAGAAPHNPVLFAFTDAEEAGLLGAKLLLAEPAPGPAAADAPVRPALARRLAVAVNLDARGTSGRSLLFETGPGNLPLLRLYQQVVAHPAASSLFYAVYRKMPNDTDFTVFRRAGLSGFNFAFTGDVARYHTPEDDLTHADLRTWQHQGEQALAVVRALADSDLRAAPAREDAVYFDVLGAALVLWPRSLTLPLAVLAAALLAACALIVRRPRWRGQAPAPLAVIDRWLWLYGPWALLSLLLAALLPEVSYPLLVPALLAGSVGILHVLRPRAAPFALLHLLPALGAALLLLPLLLQLRETLTPPLPLLAAAIALLAGLPLLPLRRPPG